MENLHKSSYTVPEKPCPGGLHLCRCQYLLYSVIYQPDKICIYVFLSHSVKAYAGNQHCPSGNSFVEGDIHSFGILRLIDQDIAILKAYIPELLTDKRLGNLLGRNLQKYNR